MAPWVIYNLARFTEPVLLSTNDGTRCSAPTAIRPTTSTSAAGTSAASARSRTGVDASVRSRQRRQSPSTTPATTVVACPWSWRRGSAASSTSTGCESLVALDRGEEKAAWAVWAGIVMWWLLAAGGGRRMDRARPSASVAAALVAGRPARVGARHDDPVLRRPPDPRPGRARRRAARRGRRWSPCGIGRVRDTLMASTMMHRRQARRAARRADRAGPRRRRLQRRRRLGVPRRRRQHRARRRAGARRDGRVAVARRRRARRLPGPGGRAGPALDAGAHRRDGPRRVPRQRPRPLLPLQGRADGRAGADRRVARGRRWCSASTSTTSTRARRPPTGPAGGARGGRGVPARRRRVHQGRGAPGVAPARTADVGQAGGGVPRQPHPVRDGGVGGRAVEGRAGRGGVAVARVPPGARAPLRRHRPHRGRAGRAGARARRRGRRSSPPYAAPATATSRSTWRASAQGNLNG